MHRRKSSPLDTTGQAGSATNSAAPVRPVMSSVRERPESQASALIGILRLAGFSVVRAEEVDDVAEGDVYVHADTPSGAEER